MAVSRGSSNGPDWRDMVTFMLELERMSKGKVVITMLPSGSERSPALQLTAVLRRLEEDDPDQSVLASASVGLPGNGSGVFEAALYLLGYELDKDWYRRTHGIAPK